MAFCKRKKAATCGNQIEQVLIGTTVLKVVVSIGTYGFVSPGMFVALKSHHEKQGLRQREHVSCTITPVRAYRFF
jgi:hypothetical protein